MYFFQDFECNIKLKNETIEFLEDIICTSSLLPSEHRASSQLLRMLTKEEPTQTPKINLGTLLTSLQVSDFFFKFDFDYLAFGDCAHCTCVLLIVYTSSLKSWPR